MNNKSKVFQNFCPVCDTLYTNDFTHSGTSMILNCPTCQHKEEVSDPNRFIIFSESKEQTSLGPMEIKNIQASATTPRMYYPQCTGCKEENVPVCYVIHEGSQVIWTYICDKCNEVWTPK